MPASTVTLNPRKAIGSKAFLVPAKGCRRPPIRRASPITFRTLDGRLIEDAGSLPAAEISWTTEPKKASVVQKNVKTRKQIQEAPALPKGSGLKQEKFGYL